MVKKAIMGILFIFLVGGASFVGWWFFLREELLLPSDDLDQEFIFGDRMGIYFSELFYNTTNVHEEWVEIYIAPNATTTTLTSWTIGIGEQTNFTLLDITVEPLSYWVIHFGTQTGWESSPYYQSSHFANSYQSFLNLSSVQLSLDGDDLFLFNAEQKVVDVISWGNALGGNYSDHFISVNDMVASSEHSLALWGQDEDTSEFWIATRPTPGAPNVDVFEVLPGVPVALYANYINYANVITNEDIMFRGYTSDNNVTITVTGANVNGRTRDLIKEHANFTINFYHNLTFGEPNLGPDEEVDIHVGLSNGNNSVGWAYSNGTVYVNVGRFYRHYELKTVVEHELMHVFQSRVREDNTTARTSYGDRWWTEGMAEYWGIRSTMANYNVSMYDVQDALYWVNSIDWWRRGRFLNRTYFFDWNNTGSEYVMMMFFIKFLEEVYGEGTSKKIHDRVQRHINGTIITAPQEAIEEELGIPMDQLIRQFYIWRLLNATTNNRAPPIVADITLPYNGTMVNDTTAVSPSGAVLERVNIENNETDITIDLETNGTVIITVIIYKADGTIEKTWFRVYPDGTYAAIPVNLANVTHIDVVKMNPDKDTLGMVNMTVHPVINDEDNPTQGTETNPEEIVIDDPTIAQNITKFLPNFSDPSTNITDLFFELFVEVEIAINVTLWQNHHEPVLGAYSNFSISLLSVDKEEIFTFNDTLIIDFNELGMDIYYLRLNSNGYYGFFTLEINAL